MSEAGSYLLEAVFFSVARYRAIRVLLGWCSRLQQLLHSFSCFRGPVTFPLPEVQREGVEERKVQPVGVVLRCHDWA